MDLPVLYSFRRCPYAMRARLALAASHTTCELREVELANKPAMLLAASPKGTVPVLVLSDGRVLEQSWDIMLWALERNDPWHWLPANAAEMANIQTWLARNDGPFKHHLDRYKYPHRYHLASGTEDRDAAIPYLLALNESLANIAPEDPPSWGLLGALALPFVRQFAHTDRAWFAAQPWNTLHEALQGFECSEIFGLVMQKIPSWNGIGPGEFWNSAAKL